MRSDIIRGFLPWIIFFAFAAGDPIGIKIGTAGGLLCLFLFNRKSLKQKSILDWAAVSFFVFLPIVGFGFHHPLVIKYGVLWAYIALTLICFGSLIAKNPFALQYAKEKTSPVYWTHPIFVKVNFWITFFWGNMFLFSAISVGLLAYGFGNKLWMIEILPTAFLVIAIAYTIIFPDAYKLRATKAGGVTAIPNLSEISHVALGNVSIAYRTLGEGPLLILLQDAYLNMHGWDIDFLKKLSQKFKILILDYPGIGTSQYQNMPFDVETLAASINEFIMKLELEPIGIVGYGMGGYIAQYLSAQYHKKLKSLILIATNPPGQKSIPPNKQALEDFQEDLLMNIADKNQAFLKHYFSKFAAQRVFEKMYDLMKSSALEGEVSSEMVEKENQLMASWFETDYFDFPLQDLSTLIIAGEQDTLIPTENAVKLSELIQPASLTIYEDAGHGLLYQYPMDIAENIIQFLS